MASQRSPRLGEGSATRSNVTLNYEIPEFVQFSSIANLQKGQEYWIEIHPIRRRLCAQLSELPERGSRSTRQLRGAVGTLDNGLTWKDISNTTALISEDLLEAPTAPPPQYDIQAQANDLSANQTSAFQPGLKGWNAYVQAFELSTFSGVAEWLSSFTGGA